MPRGPSYVERQRSLLQWLGRLEPGEIRYKEQAYSRPFRMPPTLLPSSPKTMKPFSWALDAPEYPAPIREQIAHAQKQLFSRVEELEELYTPEARASIQSYHRAMGMQARVTPYGGMRPPLGEPAGTFENLVSEINKYSGMRPASVPAFDQMRGVKPASPASDALRRLGELLPAGTMIRMGRTGRRPSEVEFLGPSGRGRFRMPIQHGGEVRTMGKGINTNVWTYGGVTRGTVEPLWYQSSTLYKGAAVLDPESNTIRVMSAQEYGLERVNEWLASGESAGLAETDIFRKSQKIYEEAVSPLNIGGTKFSDYNKLHQVRVFYPDGRGGMVHLGESIDRAIGGQIFAGATEPTIRPEIVGRSIQEQLAKAVEAKIKVGYADMPTMGLTHGAMKVEALQQGFLTTMTPGEAIAFGQHSDPAKYFGYQWFGRGNMAMESVERLMTHKEGTSSYFSPGRVAMPLIATENELRVAQMHRIGYRQMVRDKMGVVDQAFTSHRVPDFVAAAEGPIPVAPQRPPLVRDSETGTLISRTGAGEVGPYVRGRSGIKTKPVLGQRGYRTVTQIQGYVGIVLGREQGGMVRFDPHSFRNLTGGATSEGAAIANESFITTIERAIIDQQNPTKPEGLQNLLEGQFTQTGLGQSWMVGTSKVTPSTGIHFRQKGGQQAMAMLLTYDALQKAAKDDPGQYIRHEISRMMDSILHKEGFAGITGKPAAKGAAPLSKEAVTTLQDIAASIGGKVAWRVDHVTKRRVPVMIPTDKQFNIGDVPKGTESPLDLPSMRSARQALQRYEVDTGKRVGYTPMVELVHSLVKGVPYEKAKEMGLVEVQVQGQTHLVAPWLTSMHLRAENPRIVKGSTAPRTFSGFHPKGVVISEDTFRNLRSQGTESYIQLANYYEGRRRHSPYATNVIELLRSEAHRTAGVEHLGGKTFEDLAKFREHFQWLTDVDSYKRQGVAAPDALRNTYWEKAYSEGLTLQLKRPIPTSEGFTTSSVRLPPGFILDQHLKSSTGIHANQLINSTEDLLRFYFEHRGDVPKGTEEKLRTLMDSYHSSLQEWIGGGENPAAEKAIKYRADASAMFHPEQAPSFEVLQKLHPDALGHIRSEGPVKPLKFAEAEISAKRYMEIMGLPDKSIDDLVEAGIVSRGRVDGKLEYYTYGMLLSNPQLPGSTVLATKFRVSHDPALETAVNQIRIAGSTLGAMRRDWDNDPLAAVFVRDKEYVRLHRQAHLDSQSRVRRNAAAAFDSVTEEVSRNINDLQAGAGYELDRVLEAERKSMKWLDPNVDLMSREILERKGALKYVTGALHGVAFGLDTHLASMRTSGELASAVTDHGVWAAHELLGSAYQYGTVKKGTEVHIGLFNALNKVQAGQTLADLPQQAKRDLFASVLEISAEQYSGPPPGGLGGLNFLARGSEVISQSDIDKAIKLLERGGPLEELNPNLASRLTDPLAPLVEVVGKIKLTGQAVRVTDPLAVLAKGGTREEAAAATAGLLTMFQGLLRPDDEAGMLSTERELKRRWASMFNLPQAEALEEEALAMGAPNRSTYDAVAHQAAQVERGADMASTKSVDTTPFWQRVQGWFKDPARPAWQKLTAATAGVLIGGAFVRNAFFPDLVPDQSAAPPEVTSGVGPGIGTDLWDELPTVSVGGGRMPMVRPSYGPPIRNLPVSAMVGNGMGVPNIDPVHAGTIGTAPLAPPDFSMQSSHRMHGGQDIEIPATTNLYMEPTSRHQPGMNDIVRGREISVPVSDMVSQEEVMRSLGSEADIYFSSGMTQSRLDERRAINERGSLMRS